MSVIEALDNMRMMSLPNTNACLITLVGAISATRFAECWRALVAADKILGIFVPQMRLADLMYGAASGHVSETALLLR
jgi:hypothetical protein